MHLFFGLLALLGFVLALAAHLAAVAGIDVTDRLPSVWLLHVGAIACFLPFVLSVRKEVGPTPSVEGLLSRVPAWVLVAGAVIFLYVAINFITFARNTSGGTPLQEGNEYVLRSHGKLVRNLSSSEYTALRANEIRGFSGHWLVFYFVPAAYFLACRRREA